MSTQDNINNAVTRHQIFVLRYAKGRENDAAEFISRQMIEVMERLERGSISSYGSQRAEAQLKDLYLYLRETDKEYAEDFRSEVKRFADYEAEFNAKLISEEVGVDLSLPAPVQLQQAVFGDIMSVEPTKGYTIGSMLDDFGPAHANMVTSSIRSGFMLGDTTDQIARKIKELIPVQQRKASTIARTVTNHASVQARKQTLKENDDVLLGYEWVSTLDGRTSLICMSRDGIIYKDYDKDPKPPAHFNCRSTIVPKVDPRFDLGADIKSVRPAKGAKGTKQVDSETNYSAWLRKQPKSFQDEVLGKTRAELFRSGTTLDRFVDVNGRPLTIAELGDLDNTFNGVAAAIPESLIAPPQPRFDRVIPSMYTTSKTDVQGGMNAIFEEIGTPEMAKLQDFMQSKRMKALVLKQPEMSKTAKTSTNIAPDVRRYLLDDADPDTDYINAFGDDRFSTIRNTKQFFTIRSPARCNGFTSSSFRHVVVKNKAGANFKDAKQSANNIKSVVSKYVEERDTVSHWSFSNGVQSGYDDLSGQMSVTMIHELGHQVHFYGGAPSFPRELRGELLTKYGMTNDAESHAEMFVAWVVDRAALSRKSPSLAKHFDDLMDAAIKSNYRSGV